MVFLKPTNPIEDAAALRTRLESSKPAPGTKVRFISTTKKRALQIELAPNSATSSFEDPVTLKVLGATQTTHQPAQPHVQIHSVPDVVTDGEIMGNLMN